MQNLLLWRGALACLLFAAFAMTGMTPANAADAVASVSVPWGDWVVSGIASVAGLVATLALNAVRKWAPAYARVIISDALVTNAVNAALAKVAGAAKGKQLDLHVTNTVVAEALRYAVASEPKLAKWLGDKLQPLVVAKLSALGCTPDDAVPDRVFGFPVAK